MFTCFDYMQGDTILAMDFMEGGNLWEALTRVGRNGQPIYQWNGRGRRVAHDVALGLHYLHDSRLSIRSMPLFNTLKTPLNQSSQGCIYTTPS